MVYIFPARRFTTIMAEYAAHKSKQSDSLKSLTSYLRKVGIDHKQVMVASLQARNRLVSREQAAFDPTSALDILPANTQAMMCHEICRTCLRLPLFRLWEIIDGYRLVSLACKQFARFVIHCKDDEVFRAGSIAEAGYAVVLGLLRYLHAPETSPVEQHCTQDVPTGSFLAEAALYCRWFHVGTAEVVTTSDVVHVSLKKFKEEVENSAMMSWACKEFAAAFVTATKHGTMPGNFPSDVYAPCACPEEIIPSLPKPVCDMFGLCAIQVLRNCEDGTFTGTLPFSRTGLRSYCSDLEEEVIQGKCVILLHGDGSVERLATVVTLKLCRGDGTFLVHLAPVRESGSRSAKVELPGRKQKGGESKERVLSQIMDGWLRPFAKTLDIGKHKVGSTDKVHKTNEFRVKLTYKRQIMEVAVHDEPELVYVMPGGLNCQALNIRTAILLARQGSKEVEYSLWTWLSEEEFEYLKEGGVADKLKEALQEIAIEPEDFVNARGLLSQVGDDTSEVDDVCHLSEMASSIVWHIST